MNKYTKGTSHYNIDGVKLVPLSRIMKEIKSLKVQAKTTTTERKLVPLRE
jgi:hypothetical protein